MVCSLVSDARVPQISAIGSSMSRGHWSVLNWQNMESATDERPLSMLRVNGYCHWDWSSLSGVMLASVGITQGLPMLFLALNNEASTFDGGITLALPPVNAPSGRAIVAMKTGTPASLALHVLWRNFSICLTSRSSRKSTSMNTALGRKETTRSISRW